MPIPMAEMQSLRRKYPDFPPEAVVGQIAVSWCLEKGTRLRIDLMDQQQDIELDNMVNWYTILTGPVENGVYVFTYLHDVNNCKCVGVFVHVSPKAYKRAALASVVSLPRMGTYESWQQLNYQGAFPRSSQACRIIRERFTDVADNAWLGS